MRSTSGAGFVPGEKCFGKAYWWIKKYFWPFRFLEDIRWHQWSIYSFKAKNKNTHHPLALCITLLFLLFLGVWIVFKMKPVSEQQLQGYFIKRRMQWIVSLPACSLGPLLVVYWFQFSFTQVCAEESAFKEKSNANTTSIFCLCFPWYEHTRCI